MGPDLSLLSVCAMCHPDQSICARLCGFTSASLLRPIEETGGLRQHQMAAAFIPGEGVGQVQHVFCCIQKQNE